MVALWLGLSAAHALTYEVVDLGVLPGDSTSVALAVQGDVVVGNSQTFLPNAYVYDGAMVDIGNLGGSSPSSTGEAIGSAGAQVVGSTSSPAGLRAFSWTAAGGIENLGTLPGYAWSWAQGISPDGGFIVGDLMGVSASDPFVGFVIEAGGSMTQLGDYHGVLSDSSVARDVNDAGHVVGWNGQWPDTWAWRLDTTDGTLVELGHLGGGQSDAYAVNSSGAVAGTSTLADDTRKAFRWTEAAGQQLLPDFGGPSEGRGIDDAGNVVGESGPAGGGRPTASLWPASGGHVDLNDLIDPSDGWILETAADISESGIIVGKGLKGPSRAVMLVPLVATNGLGGLVPGAAGTTNEVSATATPGDTLWLVAGREPGIVPIPTVCPGVAVEVDAPRVIAGPVIVDGAGNAMFSVALPAALSGQSIWMQTVSTTTCELSEAAVQALL